MPQNIHTKHLEYPCHIWKLVVAQMGLFLSCLTTTLSCHNDIIVTASMILLEKVVFG